MVLTTVSSFLAIFKTLVELSSKILVSIGWVPLDERGSWSLFQCFFIPMLFCSDKSILENILPTLLYFNTCLFWYFRIPTILCLTIVALEYFSIPKNTWKLFDVRLIKTGTLVNYFSWSKNVSFHITCK